MKIKKDYILLMLFGLLYACNPESLPEPTNEIPVFTVSGTLGNNPVDIKAGDNDFYMFTEFSKDDTDVFTFSGTFAKLEPDCEPSCNEQLRISIRDFQFSEGDLVLDIDSSLFRGQYEYDSGIEDTTEITMITSYDVTFINKTIASPTEDFFIWRFFPVGQDSFAIETNGPNSIPETMNFPTLDFPVTLEKLNFEPFFICSDYTRLLSASESSCSASLNVTNDSILGQINFELENFDNLVSFSGAGLDNFGGGSVNESGDYCVMIEHVNGCLDTVCIGVDFNEVFEQNEYCSVAFDYIVDPQFETIIFEPENPFRFSEVVVEYVNEDGITYRSDLRPQLDESQFEILEVSDFEDNEKGEKTKQLKIRLNCVLYDETDLSIKFENAEVVMAVAYPGA